MRHELSGCVESASTTFSCVSVSAETGRNLVPHREGSDQRDASPGGLEARVGTAGWRNRSGGAVFPGRSYSGINKMADSVRSGRAVLTDRRTTGSVFEGCGRGGAQKAARIQLMGRKICFPDR